MKQVKRDPTNRVSLIVVESGLLFALLLEMFSDCDSEIAAPFTLSSISQVR
ncbi:hypothetical protein HK096_009649 [Nowakowskiella sp. JEL0078]|nr:hypothetical protein HK096_009649 [Nowakowskiella sp. JEL0078]